jgi:hypothetical protein
MSYNYYNEDWINFYYQIGLNKVHEDKIKEKADYLLGLNSDLEPWEAVVKSKDEAMVSARKDLSASDMMPYVNDFINKNLHKIELFLSIFDKYNSASYSLKSSKEIIICSLNKLSKKYDKELLPLVYTSQMIPTAYNYPLDIWREIKGIGSFKKDDFGHIDLVRAVLDLEKENIVKIKSFSILNTYKECLVIKVILEYKKSKTTKKPRKEKISSVKFEGGILYFKNEKIDFQGKQNQKDLLVALFKRPEEKWFYADIADDWGEDYTKGDWRKFYTAGDGVNKAIAIETGVKDFLTKDTKRVQINSQYL